MDAAILTSGTFWCDPTPFAAGGFPDDVPEMPELHGHVFFETSGSTGAPKWIALSKHALIASAKAVNRHLHVTHHSCWGLVLPLHHVGGFGVATRAFEAGCRFENLTGRWDPPAFAQWLAGHHVTHSSLVPTQVYDLVAAGVQAPSSLRAIVVGGGHLDVETGQAARALGWPVLASYGMTEAASQIATQSLVVLDALYQPAPIPLLPVWRAGTDHDQRLRIAGPALFSGTLVRRDQAWVFEARPSEWHQTDDRVSLENDRLTPLGRGDLRVKVLGELVDLEMIEHELVSLSHGHLAPECFLVLAVPDARAGHALVPVFDASADCEIISMVLTSYGETAPGFRRLQPPVMFENLPRSPMGKLQRRECLDRFFSTGKASPTP